MTGQAIAYPAAKLDCGVLFSGERRTEERTRRVSVAEQEGTMGGGVKPLAVIEDCAQWLSSEPAVDSVHVAMVNKTNLASRPRACVSGVLESRANDLVVVMGSGVYILFPLLLQ